MRYVDLPMQQPSEVENGRVRTPLNFARKTRIAIGAPEVVCAKYSTVRKYRRNSRLRGWTRQVIGARRFGVQCKDDCRQESDSANVGLIRSNSFSWLMAIKAIKLVGNRQLGPRLATRSEARLIHPRRQKSKVPFIYRQYSLMFYISWTTMLR